MTLKTSDDQGILSVTLPKAGTYYIKFALAVIIFNMNSGNIIYGFYLSAAAQGLFRQIKDIWHIRINQTQHLKLTFLKPDWFQLLPDQ